MNETQTGPIVAGRLDRGVEPPRRCQPRALRFTVLATLWIFPSLGALWIILADCAPWFRVATLPEAVGAVSFEQWTALVVLMLHPLFFSLAGHYRRTEIPCELPAEAIEVESVDRRSSN